MAINFLTFEFEDFQKNIPPGNGYCLHFQHSRRIQSLNVSTRVDNRDLLDFQEHRFPPDHIVQEFFFLHFDLNLDLENCQIQKCLNSLPLLLHHLEEEKQLVIIFNFKLIKIFMNIGE